MPADVRIVIGTDVSNLVRLQLSLMDVLSSGLRITAVEAVN